MAAAAGRAARVASRVSRVVVECFDVMCADLTDLWTERWKLIKNDTHRAHKRFPTLPCASWVLENYLFLCTSIHPLDVCLSMGFTLCVRTRGTNDILRQILLLWFEFVVKRIYCMARILLNIVLWQLGILWWRRKLLKYNTDNIKELLQKY